MRILVLLSALFLATVAAVRPQLNPGLKCKSDALCWESVGIKCPADTTCHTFKWATEGGLGRCCHEAPNPQKVGYWIAANDLANEGRYVWGFPSNDVVEYTDWFTGEPNNIYYDQRHEDCVAMWGHDNHNYHWNDEPCEIDEYYICQIKNGSPVLGKQ